MEDFKMPWLILKTSFSVTWIPWRSQGTGFLCAMALNAPHASRMTWGREGHGKSGDPSADTKSAKIIQVIDDH